MKKLALVLVIIASIACKPAKEKPEKIPLSPDMAQMRADVVARLPQFIDWNYVVSRNADGSAQHQGDSLLWTSLLIASARCDEFKDVESTLQRSMLLGGGQLRRHYAINDASVDGAIGLFRAVAHRIKLGCPGSWKEPLSELKAYADANHGAINENSSAGLDAHEYVLRALLDRLSGGSDPDFDGSVRDVLTEAMASWAQSVQLAYNLWKRGITKAPKAAYRAHLALLTFEALDDLGIAIPSGSRNKFCAATKSFDMPTVDHWCGLRPITEWIPDFRYNEFEYRHQRAALWETPDGNGIQTPAIDLLYAIAQGTTL